MWEILCTRYLAHDRVQSAVCTEINEWKKKVGILSVTSTRVDYTALWIISDIPQKLHVLIGTGIWKMIGSWRQCSWLEVRQWVWSEEAILWGMIWKGRCLTQPPSFYLCFLAALRWAACAHLFFHAVSMDTPAKHGLKLRNWVLSLCGAFGLPRRVPELQGTVLWKLSHNLTMNPASRVLFMLCLKDFTNLAPSASQIGLVPGKFLHCLEPQWCTA